mmetsp:Transcript_127440/g.318181  ORF Transcript_127440/g.318181 Transcript_127440/m.318181 type:complete len:211 (+) Transcript_127440:1151-1783(+)
MAVGQGMATQTVRNCERRQRPRARAPRKKLPETPMLQPPLSRKHRAAVHWWPQLNNGRSVAWYRPVRAAATPPWHWPQSLHTMWGWQLRRHRKHAPPTASELAQHGWAGRPPGTTAPVPPKSPQGPASNVTMRRRLCEQQACHRAATTMPGLDVASTHTLQWQPGALLAATEDQAMYRLPIAAAVIAAKRKVRELLVLHSASPKSEAPNL